MGKLKSKLALAKQKKAMAERQKDRLADLLRKEKRRTLNAYREKLKSKDEYEKKVTALEKEAKGQNAKIKTLTRDLKLAAERSKIATSKLRSIADSLENEGVGSGMAHVPEGSWELNEIKTEPEDPLSPGSDAAVTPVPPHSTSEPTFIQFEANAPSSSLRWEIEDLANEEGEGEELATVPLVTLNSHKAPSPSSISNDSYEADMADLHALLKSDNAGLRDTSDDSDNASDISMNSYFGLFTPALPAPAPSSTEGCPVGDWLQSLPNMFSPAPVTETAEEHCRGSTQGSQSAPVSIRAPGPSSRTLLALASNLPDLSLPPREHGVADWDNGNQCLCGRSFKTARGLASHISYFGRQSVVFGPKVTITCEHCGNAFANKGLLAAHMKRKHADDSDSGQEDPDPVPAKRQTKTRKRGEA